MSKRTTSKTRTATGPRQNGEARGAPTTSKSKDAKATRGTAAKGAATTRAPAVASRTLTKGTLGVRQPPRRAAAGRSTQRQGSGLRDRLRGIPRAAWICALVAFLNAACWSIISPPLQIPDEPSHFAYVQYLAETGHLPSSGEEKFTPAEYKALVDLHYAKVRFHPEQGTISSEAEQRKLESDLAKPLARSGSVGAAGVATSEPPLYYALETIPYGVGSIGSVLDQIALMRLFSALMGGLTGLFAFLFLREALPGARWAWTVGGLGVALTPLFGMMSGAVNPDALLFAVSAALFYCLARGFRRGITPGLAVAIGVVLAAGLVTKLSFLGLVPGAILGLVALCFAEARRSRRTAYQCLGLALGIGASPLLLYGFVNLLAGRSVDGSFGSFVSYSRAGSSFLQEVSYIWQFYLPRLPGMSHDFHGFLTTRVLWFDGLVGLYGWLDATFPNWVYNAALIPAGLIVALFVSALIHHRSALRSRVVEISVYAAIGLGVLILIGVDDYLHAAPGEYAEPRYVLPMLVLWGAVLALAARGAGRRWGPVVGVLLVCLIMAHDLFSQLLVISRYYG
jgi:hypothetical protein